MKETIIEQLKQAATKTVDYFQFQLQHDGSLGKNAKDLACYFKLPMMFLSANKKEHSQFVLSFIQSNFMTEDGDFKTKNNLKSIKPEYAEFWNYPNGWIIRAANKTNRQDILEKSYHYFLSSIVDNNNLFLTNHPELKNGISDVLTIAHHGLIHLEKNNMQLANIAGNFLCEIIEQQKTNLTHGFYLRTDAHKKIITHFEPKDARFYFINPKQPEQLYFMIAYPCAFLALLFKNNNEKRYLEYANELSNFALSCQDYIFNSHFSHKLAWAASILYSMTKDLRYLNFIAAISNYFIKNQSENGLWFEDQDLNTSYDQSAEIAYWFLEIVKNLK